MYHFNEDDVVALRNSGDFDADWYLEQYPDVRSLGMDPAEHFLWIGRALRRRCSPSHPAPDEESTLDVLFVDGALGSISTTYRVDHVARGLVSNGYRVRIVKGDEVKALLTERIRARNVVFFRAPFWSPFREFADKMRRTGAVIIYDTDDFVFDPTAMPLMDGVRFLSEIEVENYRKGIEAYREFILYSDLATVSTSVLADEIRKMGKPAWRVRNTISARNITTFKNLEMTRGSRTSQFVIGYYSGTKTHQADFAVLANALAAFMEHHEDVVFRLVGKFAIEEFSEFQRFGSRLIPVDLLPHDEMLKDQLHCDLIVAPLEVGNAFCEAKSELKFFEAALAKRPMIASATRSFREATHEGRFARLAENDSEWFAAFEDIYSNYDSALVMAEAAFEYVCADYAEEVAAKEAASAYEQGAKSQPYANRFSSTGGAADFAVLITDVIIGSGGHRKIFNICHALERSGFSVAIYVLYSSRSEAAIRNDIRRFFYNLSAEVFHFRGNIGNHRFAICTHWSTAFEFRNVPFLGKVFYFVQDFEPMFGAVGSDYMRTLATYSLGYKTICYGSWVAARLAHEIGVKSDVIPFALDHGVYFRPREERERDLDVLFFARPSQERRCFSLIMDALRSLHAARPSTRIGLFGEESYSDVGFQHQNFGLISDLNSLSELYQRTKVGICFSTTNPSQLGYEMIACGSALVDVRTKYHELNFDGEKFVKYCFGTPESIAGACLELLEDEEDLVRRRDLGTEFIGRMPSDENIGIDFIRFAEIDNINLLRAA